MARSQARIQLQTDTAAWQDALDSFVGLLGLTPETQVVLTDRLDADDLLEQSKRALAAAVDASDYDPSGTLGVAELEMRVQAQAERLKAAARSQRLPTVALGANYSPTTVDPFDTANPAWGTWSDAGALSISVSFALDRLLPISSAAAATQAARYQTEILALSRLSTADSAVREYRAALRAVQNARASVESNQLNVSIAFEVLELTQEAYDNGSIDFVTLQAAHDDLDAARLDLAGTLNTLKSTLIHLEYLGGLQ